MPTAPAPHRSRQGRWHHHTGKIWCALLLLGVALTGRYPAWRQALTDLNARWTQATIGALAPPPLPRRTPTPTPPPLRVPVPSDTMPIPLPWQQLPGFPPEWAPGGGLPVTPPTPPLIAPAAEPTPRPAWARPPSKE